VVEELDASVGRVLDSLREEGLAEKTAVFFSSDNGPWLTQGPAGGSAGLLRDGKGCTWEGGMRVPGIAWWPGTVAPNQVNRAVASTMDLFVTAAKLAGADIPRDREIDGRVLPPLETEEARTPDAFLYYRGTQLCAARVGAFKAHFITQPAYGPEPPTSHEPPLLFNLEADPSEKFNIADQHPEVVAQIKEAVAAHRATVKAVPNQLEAVMGANSK
jgi:arylsulfatase A-like enzyme